MHNNQRNRNDVRVSVRLRGSEVGTWGFTTQLRLPTGGSLQEERRRKRARERDRQKVERRVKSRAPALPIFHMVPVHNFPPSNPFFIASLRFSFLHNLSRVRFFSLVLFRLCPILRNCVRMKERTKQHLLSRWKYATLYNTGYFDIKNLLIRLPVNFTTLTKNNLARG